MRYSWIAGLFLLAAGVTLAAHVRSVGATDQSQNLIKNGLFERWSAWDDIVVGENWAPWIITGTVKFGRHGHEPGQQIQSERRAFNAGIYQEVFNVKPGAQYHAYIGSASLYWGNTEGKYEEVGRTVGIDPNGGTDPRSSNIIWGNTTWSNKRWEWKDDPNGNAARVRAIAKGTKITMFVRVEFHRGDNFVQAWLQDAAVLLENENPTGTATPVPSAPGTSAVANLPVPGTAPNAPSGNPAPVPSGQAPIPGGQAPGASVPAGGAPASGQPAGAPIPSGQGSAPIPAGSSADRLAAAPYYAPRSPGLADFPIRLGNAVIGRFFTQTAKDGQGYAIIDAGQDRDGRTTRWWSEYSRLGALDALGYPISRPFVGPAGFQYQAFQRGVLQWRPGEDRAVLANALDWLADANRDDWAFERGIPKQIKDDGSNGDYNRAVQTRLSWLTEPAINRRFREGPDPAGQRNWTVQDSIEIYGLPSSRPEKSGPFIIQRFQRVAFQYWVEDAANAPPKGSVVLVLAGDLLADAGLIPADARRSETPPPADPR